MKRILFVLFITLTVNVFGQMPGSTTLYYVSSSGELKKTTIDEYVNAQHSLADVHKATVDGQTVAATDNAVDNFSEFFGQSSRNNSNVNGNNSKEPGTRVLYTSVDKSPLAKRTVVRTQDEDGTIHDNSKTKGVLPVVDAIAKTTTDVGLSVFTVKSVLNSFGIGGNNYMYSNYGMYPGYGYGNYGIRDPLSGGLVFR